MAEKYIKGKVIKISIGGKVVAGQRGATLNREKGTTDTSNKDGDGWAENEASLKSWSVECDGLVVKDDEGYDALRDAFNSDELVDVKFGDATTGIGEQGKAIITSFPIEAPYDGEVTYAVSLTGTGPLEPIPAPVLKEVTNANTKNK